MKDLTPGTATPHGGIHGQQAAEKTETCSGERKSGAQNIQASNRYKPKTINLQKRPDAILMVSATSVVLKKKARTQCSKPIRRIPRVVKLTSAVWPDVPMTQEK